MGGFVPVPVSIAPIYEPANNTASKLKNTWEMLEKPLVLTSGSLAADIDDFARGLNLENFKIVTVDELRQCEADLNIYENQPEDLAILLLTSGSTGTPKAVMQTHSSLIARCAGTTVMNAYTSKDITLNWFSLDHVVGIIMFHLRDVYIGCQQIHGNSELVLQKPTRWLDWITCYRVTVTWGPNFAYGLINEQLENIKNIPAPTWNLSSLRLIHNGGELIVAKTARKFLQLVQLYHLPATAMHPGWGMSETSSGVVFADSFLLDSTTDEQKFVELGSPIPGFAMRIVNNQNQVVEENTIGILQVKGASVTIGYYQNPQANQEAFTTDGWGLGGIGIEIARYLLKYYQAKLLLVGRTPLTSEKHIKLYQELAQLGGEVIYESVDICDLKQLQIIVEKAQFRWGENLDGILHLAGTFHEQQVLEETQENLAAILCPKLLGAWVLHQLAKENQASIFINFSSAHGFFGSTAVGGYAAANSFLDSFTHYQNSPNKLTNKLTSYCFSWSMWDDTGMSQGYQMKNLIRAKGSYIMSCSQAISSMLASLHHQQHNLLIGLDGSNQNIQRWQSQVFNLQKLTAYFTTNTGEVVKLPGLKVQDNFGNVCIYDSVQLPEMPCLENGEVDRARLIKRSNNQENREQIEPRNEIELKIAQCWQQVLKVTLLGIHDNFFELGGNSLLAGQVISRLREDFSLELSLQRLLQAPTIVGLAQTIAAIQTVTQSQNTFTETSLQEYEEDYL